MMHQEKILRVRIHLIPLVRIIRENNETSTVHLHRNSLCSIKTQRHCSTFVDENWIRRL